MARFHTTPLAGMEDRPVEDKICVLMGLWVRYDKELAIVFNLVQLTALVAHQDAAELWGTPESISTKTKMKRRSQKAT